MLKILLALLFNSTLSFAIDHTPLYRALEANDLDLATDLIRAGADINYVPQIKWNLPHIFENFIPDRHCQNLPYLHRAVCLGDLKQVNFLLHFKANTNLRSYDGFTPMLVMFEVEEITYGKYMVDSTIFQKLLARGANPGLSINRLWYSFSPLSLHHELLKQAELSSEEVALLESHQVVALYEKKYRKSGKDSRNNGTALSNNDVQIARLLEHYSMIKYSEFLVQRGFRLPLISTSTFSKKDLLQLQCVKHLFKQDTLFHETNGKQTIYATPEYGNSGLDLVPLSCQIL